MDANVVVNWDVILPYVLSTAAPVITGFLQQYSKTFSEKAPWYAKTMITAGFGALIILLDNYVTSNQNSVVAGAVLGSVGAVNIALRKGGGRYLNPELEPPTAPAQKPKE